MFKKISVLAILCAVFSVSVFAYLSPAMESMAKGLSITKWVRSGAVLGFDDGDLEKLFGADSDIVTIKSLPTDEEGILTLFGSGVREGQQLSEDEFDELTFVPATEFEGVSEFALESKGLTGNVKVRVIGGTNFAPETTGTSADTQKNIVVFCSFSAADPDGDRLDYEIISYPRHGSVSVTADGQFVYLPIKDYIGKDEFTYIAVDEYGNRSTSATVKINVSKPASEVYFDDMKNHWAHNSAVKMASTGLMAGEKQEDGKLCFNPELDMTRGDFLALSLIMAGYEEKVPYVSKTIFADDSAIAHNIKSYAQYAYDKGIISGYSNGDGTVNFESAGAITRAEAAIIVSRILGLEDKENVKPSYTDVEGIPVWASDAVFNLSSVGIINGDSVGAFSAEKTLTRAEGAEMICNLCEYVEEKSGQKEKGILNLFGRLFN